MSPPQVLAVDYANALARLHAEGNPLIGPVSGDPSLWALRWSAARTPVSVRTIGASPSCILIPSEASSSTRSRLNAPSRAKRSTKEETHGRDPNRPTRRKPPDQLFYSIADDDLEQGFFGRRMPIHRPWTAAGDTVPGRQYAGPLPPSAQPYGVASHSGWLPTHETAQLGPRATRRHA